MCEVTIDNFEKLLEEIEDDFKSAKFISVDSEFSGLRAANYLTPSLFDNPEERYRKFRETARQIIPIQIGLCAFSFHPDDNMYKAKAYTFYIFPATLASIEEPFLCQPSSFQFLCQHNFNFNKFVYSGIPFLNHVQEEKVKNVLADQYNFVDSLNISDFLSKQIQNVTQWICKAEDGDSLELPEILEKFKANFDIVHSFHKTLRITFRKTLWTHETNGIFVVKKVTVDEYLQLDSAQNLDQEFLDKLLGFTKIFKLICNLQKPIIGHNVFLDLMLLMNSCDNYLPVSYKKFKEHAIQLLPEVYDTKTLSFELQKLIMKDKLWNANTLESLYCYFKDQHGRHLEQFSPLIQLENYSENYDNFHNAGWDAYCTGYIFIRMAHIFTAQKYGSSKRKFMSSELFQAISKFKNCVNLIRCSTSFIRLDGKDPVSRRPPCLIVESNTRKPVNISQVANLLSSFGYVEIKPFRGRKAIIAVDNYACERKILSKFRVHSEFTIQQYNFLKHSPVRTVVFWGGAIVSTVVLAWWTSRK